MIDKEHLRDDEISRQFYENLARYNVPDTSIGSVSERAESLLETFIDYCSWLSEWLAFAYPKKLVTYHHQLQGDPQGLATLLNQKLGLKLDRNAFVVAPSENYASSRFNVGTNGRWAKEFEPQLSKKLLEIMKSYHLDGIFKNPPRRKKKADRPAQTG
jgi:hypothetical protein